MKKLQRFRPIITSAQEAVVKNHCQPHDLGGIMENERKNPFIYFEDETKEGECMNEQESTEQIKKSVNPFIRLAFVHIDDNDVDELAVNSSIGDDIVTDVSSEKHTVQVTEDSSVQQHTTALAAPNPTAALVALERCEVVAADNPVADTAATEPSPKIMAYPIAKSFMEKITFTVNHESIYAYNGLFYVHMTRTALVKLAFRFCVKVVGNATRISLAKEVADQLILLCEDINGGVTPNYNIIAFENCVLNITNGEYIEPDASNGCFHHLRAAYNPYYANPAYCPNFMAYLNSITRGKPKLIERILELVAVLLSPLRPKKIFVLRGSPSAGKSVFLALIENICAEGDTIPLDFEQMSSKFGLASADGKSIIINTDAPDAPLNKSQAAILKKLSSSDDRITVEEKFCTPRVMDSDRIKVVMATNFRIRCYTGDPGVDDRLTYFVFPDTVPEDKIVLDLSRLLLSERDAIVSLAMTRLSGIVARKFHFSGQEETDSIMAELDAYKPVSAEDTLADFVDARLVFEPDAFVTAHELYDDCTAFCNGSPLFPTVEKFSTELNKILGDRVKNDRGPVFQGRARGKRGVRLRTQSDNASNGITQPFVHVDT